MQDYPQLYVSIEFHNFGGRLCRNNNLIHLKYE
uniref:Uncharacterized protein n=1 Tax=Anguilla anguilla TaxID=7936 RepID=A0A0E9RSI5_ANGAN